MIEDKHKPQILDGLTDYLQGFTGFDTERCRRGAEGVIDVINAIEQLGEGELDAPTRIWTPVDDDADLGTLRWFGQSWDAPVNHPDAKVETPEGDNCRECSGLIAEGQSGLGCPKTPEGDYLWWHRDCWMQALLGMTAQHILREIRDERAQREQADGGQ